MTALPCIHCGEPTADHIMYSSDEGWYGACARCFSERSTPYCIACDREHHGTCESAQRPTETVADAASRYLASLAGESEG